MVASRTTTRPFSTVDAPSVDGDMRKVLPYPGKQPTAIRAWQEHIYAALDDAGVLEAIADKHLDVAAWAATNLTPDDRKALTKPELSALGGLEAKKANRPNGGKRSNKAS